LGIRRREFIKAGAAAATVAGAAGTGGVVGSACGGLFDESLFEDAKLPLPDMSEYLRTVDDGMKRIAEWDRRDDIPETALDHALENDLGKKALRALYMSGMFGDLPDAGQVHPGMQARVERALPEMDEAVSEMAEYLASLSDEQLEHAQQYLKGKDNPAMEIAQWFDEVETALGVSHRRRLQTRAFVTQIVSRLKNQPPRSVFDDYIGKVEKMVARSGSPAEIERQMIARMGKDAFFERQQRLAMYAAAWQDEGVTADDFEFEDLPPVIIPDPDEIDAGVLDDTGPMEPPVPAAPAPPRQTPVPTAPLPRVAPPMTACQQLTSQYEVVGRQLRANRITSSQYAVRTRKLRDRMRQEGCAPPQKPNLTREECEPILDDAKRRIRNTRSAYRQRSISSKQAQDRINDATEPKEVRHCLKKKKRTAALICLGIGVGLAGLAIGLFFTDLAIVGAFIATPGAILLLIGLFMLAATATRYPDV
jgi:hypothetical protein